jgi:Arylsulfotransferase (ASST)
VGGRAQSGWEDAPNPGLKQHSRIAPSGLHLFDNGDLLASFQSDSLFPYSIGMAKFDKEGNVLWKRFNYSHHKFSVAPDGMIYTPAHKVLDSPLSVGDTRSSVVCPEDKIYSDVILVLDANGDTVEEIDLFHLLIGQGLAGLLQINLRTCDPIHLNYVEYVTEQMAAGSDLEAGDLIISSRHLNIVAVIDGRTRALKWVETGRTVGQHSPRAMPDGRIVVFDNRGGPRALGGSRIVQMTYGHDGIETLYPRPDAPAKVDFWSEQQGFLDPNPDGRRVLVSLAEQGLVIELDLPTGRTLWEVANSHDLGPHGPELGANAGDVVRLTALGAYYVGRPSFLANQP